ARAPAPPSRPARRACSSPAGASTAPRPTRPAPAPPRPTGPPPPRPVTDERDWLDRAAPWTRVAGPFQDLLRGALLDVHSLLLPGGAVIAGWTPSWRYVWPRDAAHVAARRAR